MHPAILFRSYFEPEYTKTRGVHMTCAASPPMFWCLTIQCQTYRGRRQNVPAHADRVKRGRAHSSQTRESMCFTWTVTCLVCAARLREPLPLSHIEHAPASYKDFTA